MHLLLSPVFASAIYIGGGLGLVLIIVVSFYCFAD